MIDIEGDGRTFARLLRFTITSPTMEYNKWTYIADILELGQRYQFDKLPRLIVPYINPCLDTSPWEVFVFASQHNFEWLARSAVSQLGKSSYWSLKTIRKLDESQFVNVPYNYTVAFIRAMASALCESPLDTVNWPSAATAFKILRS